MYLLFDFDGTLADSFKCVFKKANLLAEEYKFKKINEKDIAYLRELSSREVLKYLNIPLYKIPTLIYEMKKHLYREMPGIAPIADIQQLLEQLHKAKFTLGILTSNSVDNVECWLNTHDMRHFFNFIHSESNYFSKRFLLKKTLKKYKIDNTETFYIGDETRDIEAARKNNIKSIAVTWGYNTERTLLNYAPTFIAHKPDDVFQICSSHRNRI